MSYAMRLEKQSNKVLSLNGNGYASIADASQKGLNMGYSDFMIGFRIKLTKTIANQTSYPRLFDKLHDPSGYCSYLVESPKLLRFYIGDDSTVKFAAFDPSSLDDLAWHYLKFVVDKSSTTGLKIFLDGSEVTYIVQEDPTSLGSIDNSYSFYIGCHSSTDYKAEAQFDEFEIFNFGKDGLPADYADYIAWRYSHPHAPLSEYNSGAWNGYADADRTEKTSNGGFEDGNISHWTPGANATLTADAIAKRSGSYGGKLIFAAAAGNRYVVHTLSATITDGKYYRWEFWARRLAGSRDYGFRLRNSSYETIASTGYVTVGTSWTRITLTVQADDLHDMMVDGDNFSDSDELHIDDSSVKRVGLVAHWKLNGDYTDETTNANDLTEGGTGNAFIFSELPNSPDLLEFDPAIGNIAPRILDVSHHRAASGKNLSYKWWKKQRWEVPLDRFSKADADQINTWWEALTTLTFYPDLINSPATSYTVLLKNTTAPVAEMQPATFATHYTGILILEET